ncbi:MAG: AAA family ATPase [Armatimonadetes bacterium]|nr:AAA family ATPase [Armatimonadota bacterium]
MPSDSFRAEMRGMTVSDWQAVLLGAAEIFPGGVRSAYDVAVRTYQSALPEEEDGDGQLVRLDEFLKSVGDPPPMLIEQLVPDKAIVALSGKPKYGKSLVLLDILDSVWRGFAVFGRFRVNRPGPVVYIGMEDGRHEIANRWRRRGTQRDGDADVYICAERMPLGTSVGVEALLAQIGAMPKPPVLIGIDTAREALGITDWNDTGEVVERLRPLRDMVARKVCSVILVAHNRKAESRDQVDALSGSNAFSSSMDGFISAYKKEITADDGIKLSFHCEGRHGMRGEFEIEMDSANLTWRCSDGGGQADDRLTTTQRQALAAMADFENSECTGPQLAKAISRTSRWANDVLRQLVAAGMAHDTGRRHSGTSGSPSVIYRMSLEATQTVDLSGSTPIEKTPVLPLCETPLEPPVDAGEPAATTERVCEQASTILQEGWEAL